MEEQVLKMSDSTSPVRVQVLTQVSKEAASNRAAPATRFGKEQIVFEDDGVGGYPE